MTASVQSSTRSTSGLSSGDAAALLAKWGRNAIPEDRVSLAARLMRSLWQPVPWMLETTIVLEIALGEHLEAAIIAMLLIFNSVLGLVQEARSGKALELLKQRLAPTANVRRDGAWKALPAANIVPGDIVNLALGGIVPADATILEGDVLLDQSMLTGESAAVEASPGSLAYAGALVRRGAAVARVTATGKSTYFGRTAELVSIAHSESSEQKAVLAVVRNITVVNGGILAVMTGYSHVIGLPTESVIKLVLTAILASIPVALPATFTLAAAMAAQVLARRGVLLTHLAAVHEAASVDTLCSDKTGTLTRNELAVADVVPAPGRDRAHVLQLAALASSESGGDPVDTAIHAAAPKATVADEEFQRLSFTPFDPGSKQASAVVQMAGGGRLEVIKGAYEAVARRAAVAAGMGASAEVLQSKGQRVLAVAAGEGKALQIVGLIGLGDPPREDAGALISELGDLGVRTVMVTGDAPRTARAVARAVGLDGPLITGEDVRDSLGPDEIAVVAGVLPEHKYRLVQAFQRQGHVVGMCGDGANDAPALRQAQFGVAVSTATDIAKSAASVVLTEPGLGGIVTAIREGRRVHRRVLSYALNAITKKIELVPLLAVGLLLTGQPVLTPILMIVLLVAGDFLTMALTTDEARASPRPARWNVTRITATALVLGLVKLAFTFGVILAGWKAFGLGVDKLQTLVFLTLVLGSQAVVYVVRERGPMWTSMPSRWLLAATAADVGLAVFITTTGLISPALPVGTVAAVSLTAIGLALALDRIKITLARIAPLD